MSNWGLRYRPLLIGTGIVNARVNEPGTIGLFGQDGDGHLWLISCYHVLCDSGLGPYVQDDPIYQPAAAVAGNQVATTRATKAARDLDCAAAIVQPGIAAMQRALGLGDIRGLIAPRAGMRVAKVGAVGGLTEGVIVQIPDSTVTIRADPSFPPEYGLSLPGDSGAVWIEQETGGVVALHRGMSTPQMAVAVAIEAVLARLQLVPL
ncbi:MAG TPA: hypothetical protein VI653_22205 [Steroidobacteraceae bacterium]